ncbi:hypothetical protein AB4229_14340 [Vibrio breoganii]
MEKTYYGDLSLSRDKVWIADNIKPHVSLRFKQLFPKLHEAQRPPFKFFDTPDTAADLKWLMSRYPLRMSAKDERYLKKRDKFYRDEQSINEAILSPNYTPKERVGFRSGYALRKYQAVAVDFIERVRSAIVLDDVGLGKTYQH